MPLEVAHRRRIGVAIERGMGRVGSVGRRLFAMEDPASKRPEE